MNLIEMIFNSALIENLGWSLLNSMWHGAIVSILLWAALLIIDARFSKIRYYLSLFALAIIVGLFFRSFAQQNINNPTVSHVPDIEETITNNLIDQSILSVSPQNENRNNYNYDLLIAEVKSFTQENINIFVLLWAAGLLILSFRSIGGAVFLNVIKKRKIDFAPKKWENYLENLSKDIGFSRKISLGESESVKSPFTFGHFKPIILFPLGTFSNIPTAQLEIIIAHELAHIARADFVINLFQIAVENILFFNPAVWWISNTIRREREYCCDDFALELCKNKKDLAVALVNFEEFSLSNNYVMALSRKHNIMGRINRMENKNVMMKSRIVGIVLLLFVSTILIAACSHSKHSYDSEYHYNSDFSGLKNDYDLLDENISSNNNYWRSDDSDKTIIFHARHKGEKVKWKVKLDEHDDIISLYIDGEKIDENDYHNYTSTIFRKLDHMDDHHSHDEKYNYSYKYDHDFDYDYDFSELAESLSHLQHINIDFDSEEFEKAMKELGESLSEIEVDIDFDSEEFREDMQKMKRELRNNSRQKIHIDFDSDDFHDAMSDVRTSLRDIDFHIDLSELREDLADINVDMKYLKRDLKRLDKFLDDVREELVDNDIIDDYDDHFEMELTNSSLYIDGDIVPREVHKRILKMYENYFDKDLDEDETFRIN